MSGKENKADKEILITRVFDAPAAMVFKAWTDPQIMAKWFAPHDCSMKVYKQDFRVGGAILYSISNPSVGECMVKGVYKEIVPNKRLAHTMHLSDADGNLVDPKDSHLKDYPDWPREMLLTITFDEKGGKTTLTLHQTVSEALAKRTGAYPSWLQMLDRLAGELQKE